MSMIYIYHACVIFFELDQILSYDDGHCNQCGDTQKLVGEFDTEEERKKLEDNYKAW